MDNLSADQIQQIIQNATPEQIQQIIKNAPAKQRIAPYETIYKKEMPKWGNDHLLNEINFDDVYYFMKPVENQSDSWDDVPEYIKKTFTQIF